jgi:hypothetical protein
MKENCCNNGASILAGYGLERVLMVPLAVALLVLLTVGAGAQQIVISEFLSANSSGLRDEDGELSDWIEIYNAGHSALPLAGWHLTDNRSDLRRWTFPDLVIPGHGFVVVFASGKDRKELKAPLHANFKLDREGEYLALVKPDGESVVSEFAPAYPRQLPDISFGRMMSIRTERLLPFESAARMFVPADEQPGRSWVQPDFADAGWTEVIMGVGYDRPRAGDNEPQEPLADVTRPDDGIVPTSSNSPASEEVEKAIDNNTRTKYLNFDKLNAGFTVTPSVGPTVVTGLRLTSANDAPDRDPTSYILQGSINGGALTEIARGQIPDFPGRFVTVEVAFANTVAYDRYRLTFPTVRNAAAAVAMQIAEVELLGRSGPEPAEFAELIKTNIEGQMFGRSSSVYLRVPFTVPEIRSFERLALRVRYDDGFVAFLNGVEVARANAPLNLAYNSASLTNRFRASAVKEERYDISQHSTLIRSGVNVLAIHALNERHDSPDFLIQAEIENTNVELGEELYFSSPTPGSDNRHPTFGLLPDLVVAPARGFYEAPIEVVISCATEGATIRYTTDGSTPSAARGQTYSGPVRIGRTATLRAVAILDGWHPSEVATHTYLFLDDVVAQTHATTIATGFPQTWNGQPADYGLDPRVVGPPGQDSFGGKYRNSLKADLRSVPSMSIVMNVDDLFGPEGIYSNPLGRGAAWERAASLELICPDDRESFHVNAGIRIQGGAFRRFDLTMKKSFRVVFRDQYGSSKLRHPLFGEGAAEEFDNIVLRANSNDAWPYWGGSALYVRDAFAMETARAMGMVAPHTRFVHLYLNGVYWGLYNPVERPDAAFSATYHGGDKDSWDAVNQDSVTNGTYDAWNRLMALLNQGVSSTQAFQRIQGNNPDGTRNPEYENLIDVENMIDYMILNFYVGNTDWPGRNWWVGRNRDQGDGFKFYPWDTETALGVTGLDVDRTGVADAVARPYAAARTNAEFRMQFADRVYVHFQNGGAFYVNPASPAWDPDRPENNQPAARFAALAQLASRAIVGESARWGDQLNRGPFTRDEHWQRERDSLLANFFPRRSAVALEQFRRAGLYPRIDPPVMNKRGGQVTPGFQLALSSPQGTIYYTTDGSDPLVPVVVQEVFRQTLVSSVVPKKVLIPSTTNGGSQLGTSWHGGQEPFDDSTWLSGSGGVGYDQEAEYRTFIQFDVQSQMLNKNASAFIRIPFHYSGVNRDRVNFMALRAQFDDGFVAFLNGRKIASANEPSSLQWNSAATSSNPDTAAVQYREFKADDSLSALRTGANILAIHGLNAAVASTDFLIGIELVAGERRTSGDQVKALAYSEPIAIRDLTTVKTRVFDGSEWSALNEATFNVGTPAVTITELQYHPSDPTEAERAAGFTDAEEFEFVELYNHGTGTCDLEGARFIAGISFDFTGSSITRLAPGRYVLVVRNIAAFEHRYGPGLPIAGEYSGRLDNSGERIHLVNARNETLVEFAYGTRAPWPRAADGNGPSLELLDPAGDLNSAENWQASQSNGGSPGFASGSTLLPVDVRIVGTGQLQFRFSGKAGSGYSVFVRESLSSGSWKLLERGEPIGQNQEIRVDVQFSPETECRFFRVSVP